MTINNYFLNLEELVGKFHNITVEDCADNYFYNIPSIVGPRDLICYLKCRENIIEKSKLFRAKHPVDYLVWAKGNADNVSCTKVGGVPYRPLSRPWPRNKSGNHLPFICQFNFVNSRDIVNTENDVMLFFADIRDSNIEDWCIEWHDLTLLDDEVITPPPEDLLVYEPYHGYLFRHYNLDEDIRDLYNSKRISQKYNLSVPNASCIGNFIEGGPSDERFISNSIGNHNLLCRLASIEFSYPSKPHPFVNIASAIDCVAYEEKLSNHIHFNRHPFLDPFQVGDGGSIYFYRNNNGDVVPYLNFKH